MRAFLELLGDRESLADLAQLAPKLARGELDALRAEGFLQPTAAAASPRNDLGLIGLRSRQHRPQFEMLMAFCENDGWLKTRPRRGPRTRARAAPML